MATAGFSFEEDIAPLRGENFGGMTASGLQYQAALDRQNAIRIAEINQTAKNQAERSQLEFEKTKLQLEAARRETRQQIEAENLYPKISERITGILNDQTKDPVTKVTELEKTRTEFGAATLANPAINNIFNAASSAITVKDQQESQRNALAANLTQLGQPEAVKALFGGNVDSGPAKQFFDSATAIGIEKKKEEELSKNAAFQKLQAEEQSKLRQEDLDILKGHESALRSFAPKGTSDDDFIAALQSGVAPTATKDKDGKPLAAPEMPAFSPLQVMDMKEMLMDLNPSLQQNPAQLDSVPPEELYRYAFRAISRKRRGYLQTPSKTTTKNLFEE
ncbi:MAG: hypothetical protein ACK5H0_10205 [Bacteroidota bacterium]|jgi:hypothetical protein